MGKHDNRLSNKMRQRKRQKKLKERQSRRAKGTLGLSIQPEPLLKSTHSVGVSSKRRTPYGETGW